MDNAQDHNLSFVSAIKAITYALQEQITSTIYRSLVCIHLIQLFNDLPSFTYNKEKGIPR